MLVQAGFGALVYYTGKKPGDTAPISGEERLWKRWHALVLLTVAYAGFSGSDQGRSEELDGGYLLGVSFARRTVHGCDSRGGHNVGPGGNDSEYTPLPCTCLCCHSKSFYGVVECEIVLRNSRRGATLAKFTGLNAFHRA